MRTIPRELYSLLFALTALSAAAVDAQTQASRMHAVGYSVTANAICGTSGLFFVNGSGLECFLFTEYGGGIVGRWHASIGPPAGPKWRLFQRGIEFNGQPSIVFWQIGYVWQETSNITQNNLNKLLDILAQIRLRAPGAAIYVSGMSAYSPSSLCPRVAGLSVTKSWNAAGILWGMEPDVFMGPVMPIITPAQSSGEGDSCHLSRQGRLEHGAKLHEFFDPLIAP